MRSTNHFHARFLAFALLLPFLARLSAQPAPAGEIEQGLRKLNELGTVLMIGAHPDDERTNVLAYFARGRHMRAAYLASTRGEGGQNIIGPEQGAALGLIRTQELLDARRVDGAEQFFTRAIDFGFTKTADETMKKWGHDRILADMVWVIRRYRPDIIVPCHSGTPSDGHGQHQATGILAREAFEAAGDPTKFPEQLRYVQPWRPAKLVSSGGGRGGAGQGAQINTSGYDPLSGYSFDQLASMSRGMHRSQGFGALGMGGGAGRGGLGAAAADAGGPDVFDGIDHTWSRLPGGAAVGALVAQAIREFAVEHPEKTIPALAKARPLVAAMADPLAKVKLAELDELIARCAAIWADAQARQGETTPGARVPVSLTVLARLPVPVTVQSIRAEGLWSQALALPPARPNGLSGDVELEVPAAQPASQPYWLAKPPTGDTYTVEDQTLIGLADSPVERIRIALTVNGVGIELTRPVVYRYNDRLDGEKVRPITVTPPVSVILPLAPDLSPNVALFPTAEARRLQAVVKANAANAEGALRLELPAGWKAEPRSQPFRLSAVGDQQELAFLVTPPASEANGALRAIATVGGRDIETGMASIAYVHIPTQTVFPPSDVKLVRSDIAVTARRIGYVMGAGDEVPDALRQLGLEVTLLGEDDLRRGDLSRFDAIVAGVRAYNVRADLRAYQQRLLDYVNNGGTYVVQYMSAGAQNIGPYPIAIAGGNGYRVTVEEAPVAFPHPESALLQKPNKIGPRDFEGWVQERALLIPTQWDPHYETVLSCGDPGEKPLEGAELWTRYGKGVYIFSSYVWFRQLPAGVPGAFRLFANMLSAK
jgi:LmbE family N-acetylglucosaminyl deacetylase